MTAATQTIAPIYVTSWAAWTAPRDARLNRYEIKLMRSGEVRIVDLKVTDHQSSDESVVAQLHIAASTRELLRQDWAIGDITLLDFSVF